MEGRGEPILSLIDKVRACTTSDKKRNGPPDENGFCMIVEESVEEEEGFGVLALVVDIVHSPPPFFMMRIFDWNCEHMIRTNAKTTINIGTYRWFHERGKSR